MVAFLFPAKKHLNGLLFFYILLTEETEGPFYAKDLGFRYNGLDLTPTTIDAMKAQGDYSRYPGVSASFSEEWERLQIVFPTDNYLNCKIKGSM